MSLQLAAQHLQAHGRGSDNHLVHMTSGELQALQDLAVHHGGSLTVNPHTGLPEAGFLSSLLPMLAGAALNYVTGGTWSALQVAGTIGLADAALTGSLSQGLMAGLGAWGGANLAGDIANFNPANDPSILADKAAARALPEGLPSGTTALPDTASQYWSPASDVSSLNTANPINNLGGMPGAGPSGGYVPGSGVESTQTMGMAGAPSAPPASNLAQTANGNFVDPNAIVKTSAATGSAPWGTSGDYAGNWDKFKQGASNVADAPGQFIKDNMFHVGSVALPLISAANQPEPYQPPKKEENPMHLKVNPEWKGPTQPDQPNPYYKAIYKDYTKNPFSAPMTAAGGGLMDVSNYKAGGDANDPNKIYDAIRALQEGMSPPKIEMPANHLAYHRDPGIYTLSNADYAKTSPLQHMAMNQIKMAPGLAPTMSLGSYSVDPAIVSQQDINKQAAKQDYSLSAKEGGLSYADGGVAHYASGSFLVPNSGNFKVAPPAPAPAPKTQINNLGIPIGDYLGAGINGLPRDSSPTGNMSYPNGGSGWGYNLAMQQLNSNSPKTTAPAPAPVYNAQNLSPNFAAANPAQNNAATPNMNGHIYIPHYNHGGGVEYNMGGLGSLGSYSDGGRLLKGPGDGVSDSIPASIGNHQPARLAEGEFVIPARIVSELGNGSTDAGAKRLYAMMDRIKAKRAKTKDIAADTKAYKYLPA